MTIARKLDSFTVENVEDLEEHLDVDVEEQIDLEYGMELERARGTLKEQDLIEGVLKRVSKEVFKVEYNKRFDNFNIEVLEVSSK